jgi:hypothetical protein
MERDIDAYLRDTHMTEKHTSTSSVGQGRRGESREMPAKQLEQEVDVYLKDTRTLEKHKSASPIGRDRGGERPAKRMERELYAYIRDTQACLARGTRQRGREDDRAQQTRCRSR